MLVPPKGYLQRLRQICDKHGILLIFDEVITGFGRLGASFATEYFGVVPDIITTAKGITNGTVPMGRSEEHTSELQSLMRISYAVFCLKKKKYSTNPLTTNIIYKTLHTTEQTKH